MTTEREICEVESDVIQTTDMLVQAYMAIVVGRWTSDANRDCLGTLWLNLRDLINTAGRLEERLRNALGCDDDRG